MTNTMKRDILENLYMHKNCLGSEDNNLFYNIPENQVTIYGKADMSKFLALIIDSLNHDITIGAVMNPTDKIHALLEKYARGEQI